MVFQELLRGTGVCVLLVGMCLTSSVAAEPRPETRPFHLGFTRWPADLTMEGFLTAQNFAHEHGDIVGVMFIGGIPWPEALADEPFSTDVKNNLSYQPPQGTKLFLSISPLDQDRANLAPYWGEKDNLPLPGPWKNYALNSQEVKTAYRKFVLRAVEAMQPDYLAIGIENNVLLSKSAVKWEQLTELHRETYQVVKQAHPQLPVCFTTEVLHYKKLASDARGSNQEEEVANLMKYSDLFAMSVYPHMSYDVPRPVPADFFDFAHKFEKPICVSETGDTSRDVESKAFGLTGCAGTSASGSAGRFRWRLAAGIPAGRAGTADTRSGDIRPRNVPDADRRPAESLGRTLPTM